MPSIDGGSAGTLLFCCPGCHGAYLLITGAGLDDFYRRRQATVDGPSPAAFQETFDDAYLSRFVRPAGDASAIDIIIDGIRCASCVWLNEKVIGRIPGVKEARVNYATGRARVVFEADTVTPAGIFSRIAELGYRPRPYSETAREEGARREQRDLLFRLGTAFFLTMQLMAYSFSLYAGYLQGMDAQTKEYLQFFSLLVTTPVIFYSGRPFLSGAWRSVVNRAPNMDLLIALGALSSYLYSVYQLWAGGEVYFETAAMIVTLILAGRLLENMARRRASGGIEHLLGLCPAEAHRVTGDGVEKVDPAELKVGDLVLVAAGERFPVDGEVRKGTGEVDESPATGEALPVLKSPGDPVIAGSCNLSGTLTIACEKEAADSFIARVARLVEEAQSRRAPIQGIADRVSAVFVPAVLALSAATFLWKYLSGHPLGASLMDSLSVLVIACPCALGLATPTAMVAATGAAAMGGVIFRGGDVLEKLSRIKSAAFDKTGTLTCGSPTLVEILPAKGHSEEELLATAAALEAGSRHPLGKALVQAAQSKGLLISHYPPLSHTLPPLQGEGRGEDRDNGHLPLPAEEIKEVAGGGITGLIQGKKAVAGSPRFLTAQGVAVPTDIIIPDRSLLVCVAVEGAMLGTIVLRDRLREDAKPLAAYLERAGIETVLLSGDRVEAARETAEAVGIKEWRGELSPADKVETVERLRARGGVLMVGDGINDAPALSAADVGCAVAGGTDLAVESSELVLVKPNLERLIFAHRTARRAMNVIRENLVWAFLYNAIGIPLAMTGKLTPIYAAAAMALSSICVVGNSLRLTRSSKA
ncbi:heavy metal translocating P-type ATPase [Geomonas sp. Red32]|nr:heavy metal translocating P-type ATPase [Geomonas sp. Red32]